MIAPNAANDPVMPLQRVRVRVMNVDGVRQHAAIARTCSEAQKAAEDRQDDDLPFSITVVPA
jgi:hypothetical protein